MVLNVHIKYSENMLKAARRPRATVPACRSTNVDRTARDGPPCSCGSWQLQVTPPAACCSACSSAQTTDDASDAAASSSDRLVARLLGWKCRERERARNPAQARAVCSLFSRDPTRLRRELAFLARALCARAARNVDERRQSGTPFKPAQRLY